MNDKIRQGMKNNKGSSLAFVLIISMVLMIMVASIMTVANSGFTFTQETVESRQAYIDAKSVIEFGKIKINENMTNIKAGTPISSGISFNVYGSKDSLSENLDIQTLSLSPATGKDILGVCTVKRLDPTLTDPTTTKYTFDIKTQKLRRNLDFKTAFDYKKTKIPDVPIYNNTGWLDTQIKAKNNDNGNSDPVSCVIEGGRQGSSGTYNDITKTLTVSVPDLDLKVGTNKNRDKFDWMDGKILNLTARNIGVVVPMPTDNVNGSSFFMTAIRDANNPGQICFEENYNQVNKNKNTLNADNIVFIGDLVIDESSYLEINCVNLWVKGNISIKTNVTAPAAFINRITATNIIVGGKLPNNKTISISDNSRVVWKYTNFLLNDVVNTTYTNAGSPGETGEIINQTTQYY